MGTWIKRLLVLLVVVGTVGGTAYWLLARDGEQPVSFRTAAVKRGDLTATISATGTVEPEEVVDVGAQVAGQILEFGKDADGKQVDYRSHVEEGMLLARIDDAVYQSEVASSTAQLASARAGVERAKADLQAAQARQVQAERDWGRAEKLGPSEALAAFSYDAYRSARDTAVAQVAVSRAMILQAEASVAQAQASLDRANRNLGFTAIKSPVKGVVIARRVNIGQTVVASLNAPSLFLIAKDLRRIQVWVPVNEADVGQLKPGQTVTFTTDAFPGRPFKGEVGKVRLEPTITQNVVTYTVEVETENPDEVLLPYLTANVKFVTNQKTDVLSVPNAALRYTPAVDLMLPEARDKYAAAAAAAAQPSARPPGGGMSGGGPRGSGGGGPGGGGPGGGGSGGAAPGGAGPGGGGSGSGGGGPRAGGGPGGGGGDAAAGGGPVRKRGPGGGGRNRGQGTVWVAAGNGLLKPIEVKTGMTDGASTELLGDELAEGTEVVTGEAPRAAAAGAGGTNPFAPSFGRSSGRPR